MDGSPLWIAPGAPAASLRRVDLAGGTDSARYDEEWLQSLLHSHPGVFPVEQVEPGFGTLVPLCRELPLEFGAGRCGALDNLFATPEGGLALVEAKLWRNPEARRSAVAQAMEYAAAVFRMGYDELEAAVARARRAAGEPAASLFRIVSGNGGGVDEAAFVDGVTRNLARGRAVVAVVGDGIREDIMPLAGLLQSHAGHRLTFALVELAVYEAPDADVRVVVPSVLAQTTLIERGVVRIENEAGPGLRVEVAAPVAASGKPGGRRMAIGEDKFFKLLGRREPGLPQALKAFLAKVEGIGVYAERAGGLSLKHPSPDGRALNMGTVTKEGLLNTGPATWGERMPQGRAYGEALAGCIGGSVVFNSKADEAFVRGASGRTPRLSELLPTHEQAWLDAMGGYIRSCLKGGPATSAPRPQPGAFAPVVG